MDDLKNSSYPGRRWTGSNHGLEPRLAPQMVERREGCKSPVTLSLCHLVKAHRSCELSEFKFTLVALPAHFVFKMLSTSRDSKGHGKKSSKGLDALWVKHSFVWTSRFPWLIAVEKDGKVISLGCTICCNAPESQRDKNGFAECSIKTAQTSVFQKHQDSAAHTSRSESFKSSGVPIAAPSANQFAECLQSVWRGEAELKESGPWKCRVMMWCMAEAGQGSKIKTFKCRCNVKANKNPIRTSMAPRNYIPLLAGTSNCSPNSVKEFCFDLLAARCARWPAAGQFRLG